MEANLEDLAPVRDAFRLLAAGDPAAVHGQAAELVRTSDGEFVQAGRRRWKVQGSERLRVTEVAVPRAPADRDRGGEATCQSCGTAFTRSKYNPYFTECPACRAGKKEPAQGRTLSCARCGAAFVVSKYHPDDEPKHCPRCRKYLRHREYLKRRRARSLEGGEAEGEDGDRGPGPGGDLPPQ